MATKGERQALLFLAAVAILGGGTRLYRARRVGADPSAVGAQLEAVERARSNSSERKAGRKSRSGPRAAVAASDSVATRMDLDRATAAQIENLPGIGPALARRIVADRETHGPFGCLQALDAVKGVGPALLKRIDTLATFTGPGRAACATGAAGSPPR